MRCGPIFFDTRVRRPAHQFRCTHEGGAPLIYAACFDITAEREASEEVRFQAQLSELMLDRSRMMSFDYDPIEDMARSGTTAPAGGLST